MDIIALLKCGIYICSFKFKD